MPIQKVQIEDEMKKSYIDYAMSVIIGRAIPDVRDGLKPVHRRILYSMFDSNFTHTQPHHKCARIVGDCLGKYHPHGDSSVYDALVRMAQDFSLRYPLIDGQGNFGSVDGDPPAAMRYTEARLAKIASEMLEDLNRDTVDFIPNFDESLSEPTCLPSKLPNLLINGTAGIAVGMATNMPPYNLREICDAIVKVVDNPNCYVDELLEVISGPDFPTGGIILGRSGIRNAIKTGRGKLVVRARTEIDEEGPHPRIIVTEIPYQVNKAKLVEDIGKMVNDKKIEGIKDLRDESDRNGFRIVIDLKKDVAPIVVLNHLFKHTQLQTTFGVTNLVLTNRQKKPEVLNVLDLIKEFIAHREEVITRRTLFELDKANKRLHLVEGLLLAVTNIDEIVRLIRESQDPAEAETKLCATSFADIDGILTALQSATVAPDLVATIANKALWNLGELVNLLKIQGEKADIQVFLDRLGIVDPASIIDFAANCPTLAAGRVELKNRARNFLSEITGELQAGGDATRARTILTQLFLLTDVQAKEILNMRLARLTALQIDELKGEEGDLHARILNLEDIIDHKERRMDIIKEETAALREEYGDDRRTEITRDEDESTITDEDLVKEENVVIMLTQNHYIKRMPLSEYQAQKRGGKGRRGIKVSGEDFVRDMFVCSSHDTIMFFTASGRVYAEQAYTIPEMSRSARGKSIANFLQLESEEEINNLIPVNDFEAKLNLMMVTKRGQVKKTPLRLYRNIRKSGLTGIKLREGDELIDVKLTDGESNILIATKDGQAIKFEETDCRPMGRSAQGVRGIRLYEGDEVIGMIVAREDEAFTTVTKFGYGKRSLFENYRLTGRACRGIINIKFYEEGDEVVAVKGGADKQEI
ncbi:MAG TPA: DNA gyrase subunit A, partial [Candidatus Lokiarchaeia archaeon]|nr:DNA gyrase subunit A [Candidatus Lokiarchaeia archaeon]